MTGFKPSQLLAAPQQSSMGHRPWGSTLTMARGALARTKACMEHTHVDFLVTGTNEAQDTQWPHDHKSATGHTLAVALGPLARTNVLNPWAPRTQEALTRRGPRPETKGENGVAGVGECEGLPSAWRFSTSLPKA